MAEFEYQPGLFRKRRLQIAEQRIAECIASKSGTLDLSGLRLREVPESIRDIPNLVSLDVSGNDLGLGRLPDWIGSLNGLQKLDVSGNSLGLFPESLGSLTELQSLDVGHNVLHSLPDWMGSLTGLQSLSVGGNKLGSLPDWMGLLTGLQSLNVWNNGLDYLPDWMGTLTGLQSLDVSGNDLGSLPDWMGSLTRLRSLDVGGNGLGSLPDWMGSLTGLQSLHVWNNGLNVLPEWVGLLTGLQSLNVWRNSLVSLPDWMGTLTGLQSLEVGHNNLGSLPDWMGTLTGLQSLDVSGNDLGSLPDWMGSLTGLRSLDVGGNGLGSLPDWMGSLTGLQTLNVGDNDLGSLPDWLGSLTGLQSLKVGGNGLSSLPDWMGSLAGLQSLEASFIGLGSLPDWMGSLTGLQSLNVLGNPLGVDTHVLLSTDPDTLFEALYAKDRVPLNEVRVLIVGEGTVGKSTLVGWLTEGKKVDKGQTPNIEVTKWLVKIDEVEVLARVWDFGGQQIYQATHHNFLSDRCVYVLVLDARRSYKQNDTEKWIKTVRHYAPQSPIVIAINRNKTTLDVPIHRLTTDYGNLSLVEFFGENGEGVDQVAAKIQAGISEMPFVRESVPKSWVTLKDKVAGDSRPYLTWQEYEALCDNLVDEPGSRENVQKVLDALGVALEHRGRKGLYILDPDWIIQGVYAVLNAPVTPEDNGRVVPSKALLSLDPKRYKASDLELMIGFMIDGLLAVRIQDCPENSILVPDLARSEPIDPVEWPEDCQVFYEYDQLLEGFLPRLIAQEFGSIVKGLYWRSGFIASYRGRLTQIEADIENRQVRIRVQGTDQRSREALAVAQEVVEKQNQIAPYINVAVKKYCPIKGHPGKRVQVADLEYAESLGHDTLVSDRVVVDIQQHLGGIRVEKSMTNPTTVYNQTNHFAGPGQAAQGDNVHQQQNNDLPEFVSDLIAKLIELDGGTPSSETNALQVALADPNASKYVLAESVEQVAKKGQNFKEAVKAFGKGMTDGTFQQAGKGMVWLAANHDKVIGAFEMLKNLFA